MAVLVFSVREATVLLLLGKQSVVVGVLAVKQEQVHHRQLVPMAVTMVAVAVLQQVLMLVIQGAQVTVERCV